MSITTITGLGSGLDIKNLVPALVEAEKAPKQAQINIQKARNETQLSAVGMLKSALETFESSLLGLKSSSTAFDGYKATSSKEGVASVTLQPNATNITQGSYVLKVDNLASASKVASKVQADGISTRYAAGELTISIGASGTPHKITVAENSTLDQIRDAINDRLSSVGVTAGIISDSNGARLVLSSELPGAGNDIMVTGATAGAGTGVDLAELNIDGTQQQSGSDAGWLVQSKDAKYSIDGLEMTSKSNVITGVQGLNIRLLEEGTTTLSGTGGNATAEAAAGRPGVNRQRPGATRSETSRSSSTSYATWQSAAPPRSAREPRNSPEHSLRTPCPDSRSTAANDSSGRSRLSSGRYETTS